MSLLRLALVLIPALACVPLGAQTAGAAVAPAGGGAHWVSETMRPALGNVAQVLQGVMVRRWKAPGSVRDAVDNDIAAIQRDLSGTLAGLLQQADAAPGSVPTAFAVYRNVNALYDTLLRVAETAQLAAPDQEAAALESALNQLESARESLGDGVLSGAEAQQSEVVRLRAAFASASAAERHPVRTTVVDDGPERHEIMHRRHTTSAGHKKTPEKKPAAKPATGQPQP